MSANPSQTSLGARAVVFDSGLGLGLTVLRVIQNAVHWRAFAGNDTVIPYHGEETQPLEKLSEKDYTWAPIDHPR